MKFIVLSLLTVLIASEASAQTRGSRYNNPGSPRTTRTTTVQRPTYSQPTPRRDYGYSTPTYSSSVRVVGPRYNPPGRNTRVIRTVRRTPVIWNTGFRSLGYRCDSFDLIQVTNYSSNLLARFRYSYECDQALYDIEVYGDFCINDELHDQSGIVEAYFNSNYECRNALGYYY